MFSKRCQYAMRAMAYLGSQPRGRLVAIRDIGEHTGIPLPFLSKIISTLSRRGLVRARRGPHGGVTLRGTAADVTLGDVIEAIDGPLPNGACVLGLDACSEEAPCPIHDSWRRVRAGLGEALHDRSLADLSRASARRSAAAHKRRSGGPG